MIYPSETWTEVETKLVELRKAIDSMWDKGDWQAALTVERLFGTVKKSMDNSASMRKQANNLITKLELIEAYKQFPIG